MADLPEGEINLWPTSKMPSFIEGGSAAQLVSVFRKWVEDNFEASAYEVEFYEYANDDELLSEWDDLASTASDLLKSVWGKELSVDEFDNIVSLLGDDFPDLWYPHSDRVEIEEVEEDEPLRFETLYQEIPRLRRQLNAIKDALPAGIGHNNPPDSVHMDAKDIQELEELFAFVENRGADVGQKDKTKLARIAALTIKVGATAAKYVGKTGDAHLQAFAKTSGESAGKWFGPGLVVLLAGNGLATFGEALLKLIN